jgi:hypothetical protein
MHCVTVVVFLRVFRIVFRVDAVGKEAALAFRAGCVLDLQRRGSQTVYGKVLNGLLDGGQPNPLPFNSLSDTWPRGQGEGLIREQVRNL